MAALYYNDKKVDDNLTYVKIEGEFEANNQSKTIDITENGETTVTYDEGYTGLESVTINTHIQGGGGDCGDVVTDWSAIGWVEVPEDIDNAWAYAKEIYDNWDSSVTNRDSAFEKDKELVYFPAVDTSNVTTMYDMFNGCTNLQIVPHLDTSNVASMGYMFNGCNSLTSIDLSSFNTSKVSKMNNMFSSCNKLTSLDLSGFDTSKVTDMGYMFRNCSELTSLDVSNFDTSNVTSMVEMFQYCSGLTSLDLSSFNTSKVTTMKNMFYSCSGLTSIDLSGFDTSKVTDMGYMFSGCSGLTSLDLSNFDTSKATTISYIFQSCPNLKTILGILDIQKITGTVSTYYFIGYSTNSSIRKLTFRNLGYNSNNTSYSFTYITNLGVNSVEVPDARESLIDSLLTYSFDRATAGYSTCTISLHANSKAVLSEDEIAKITAKGYTIA